MQALTAGGDDGSLTGDGRKALPPRQRHPWELDAQDLVLGKVIGAGGYGRVFQAEYKGGAVAVKTLFSFATVADGSADDILADTAAEAQVLSQLRHVNTLRFFGVSYLRQEGCIAMVTELCQQDLRAWIDQPGAARVRVQCSAVLSASVLCSAVQVRCAMLSSIGLRSAGFKCIAQCGMLSSLPSAEPKGDCALLSALLRRHRQPGMKGRSKQAGRACLLAAVDFQRRFERMCADWALLGITTSRVSSFGAPY